MAIGSVQISYNSILDLRWSLPLLSHTILMLWFNPPNPDSCAWEFTSRPNLRHILLHFVAFLVDISIKTYIKHDFFLTHGSNPYPLSYTFLTAVLCRAWPSLYRARGKLKNIYLKSYARIPLEPWAPGILPLTPPLNQALHLLFLQWKWVHCEMCLQRIHSRMKIHLPNSNTFKKLWKALLCSKYY